MGYRVPFTIDVVILFNEISRSIMASTCYSRYVQLINLFLLPDIHFHFHLALVESK